MQRFVFIGFDAADYRLIRRWAQDGTLPMFRRLLATSAVTKCRSPFAFFVGAQWPSFYTGLNPAGHGRYCYSQLVPGGYDDESFPASSIGGTPFWDALGTQGRRFTVTDVPKTVLSDRFSGTHVVDWATHDSEKLGMQTAPAPLAKEIVDRYGKNPDDNCNRIDRTVDGYRSLRDRLIDRVHRKERLLSEQLAKNDWDAFVAVFADTHCAGHQFWHLHDPRHDRFDQAVADAVGNPLRDVYSAVDAALGRLLPQIPADCLTMVFASHGIGPHWDGTHLMDDVLARLDDALPHGRPPQASRVEAALRRRGQEIRPYRLRKYLPKPLSHRIFRKAFWVPNNEAYLGTRINLEGREPLGRIRPGSEFDAYCAALMQALRQLRVGPNGPPAFADVALTSDHLRGARLDTLPDIVARWTRVRPFEVLASPMIGEVRGRYEGPRSGDHYPDGLLLVSGGNIVPGDRPPCAVEDLAPTFGALLGGDIGPVDGVALDWLPRSAPSSRP
jgi:predicted AlkP superfamily phosphohydrolase/phosphomutase